MTLQPHNPVTTNRSSTVFDATTMLVPDVLQPGQFDVYLDPVWASLIGLHGGYLAAVAIKAAQIVAGDDRPVRTATTSFLRPVVAGPATSAVEVVRTGRSITNLTVTLYAVVTRSRRQPRHRCGRRVESTSWETVRELDLPPIERCVPIEPPPGIGHFDHGVALLDPSDLPFSPRTARPCGRLHATDRVATNRCAVARHGSRLVSAGVVQSRSTRRSAASASATRCTSTARSTSSMTGEWLGGSFHADISAEGMALEKGLIVDPAGRILAESFHTRWTADPRS